jgi:hypothetical protein
MELPWCDSHLLVIVALVCFSESSWLLCCPMEMFVGGSLVGSSPMAPFTVAVVVVPGETLEPEPRREPS